MPGLCFSNELHQPETGSRLEFAVALYQHLQTKCDYGTVVAIVRSAVEIEEEFITEALPCRLIGMDAEQMTQYIRYAADRLLKQLGQAPFWVSKTPLRGWRPSRSRVRRIFSKNV
jgi:ribonucleotide reductase beta subunit family protein with ferritin-like domain